MSSSRTHHSRSTQGEEIIFLEKVPLNGLGTGPKGSGHFSF